MNGQFENRNFFSSDSIRERYAQKVNGQKMDNTLLLDMAGESVAIWKTEGKSDDEIRLLLKDRLHFSDEMAEQALSMCPQSRKRERGAD